MKKIVPVYPWPMHPKVAEVLEAIEGIQLVEARAGSPDPILAVGKPPAWACDSIVVTSPEKAAQAVDIVISNGIQMVTVRDWLSAELGVDLPQEKLTKVEQKGPRFQ